MILHKLKTNRFTMVENALILDKRLSWKAKGIMLYLLSKPNKWEIHVSDIMNHGTEREHAVRAGMNELRRAGYAKLENIREHGRILARRITISEAGGLVDAFLNVENLNEEKLQANKTDSKQDGGKRIRPSWTASVDFADANLQEEWAAFQLHRKQSGAPMTPLARRRAIEKLNEWGKEKAIEAMRESIQNGWRGLFEPKGSAKKPTMRISKRNEIINKLNRRKAELTRKPQTKEVQRELAAIQTQLYKL